MEIKPSFAADGPPISVIATKLAGASLQTENSGCALTFHFSNRQKAYESGEYLEKCTFVVGDCLSIADIAIWSALAGTGQRWESLRKSKRSKKPVKWFNSVATEYSDSLNEATAMYVEAALLNQYYAQRYQSQLIVRFDDTNRIKESNEFVDNLLKDIETLGIKYEEVSLLLLQSTSPPSHGV
ncbi:hypothetical protein Pint_06732 [Pistacia integerrima]|uniref:Uncharacterized protein n=1 Tax=Pistacia integerrima TaxID=434235 RepID=A0ACC0XTE7_9ROSI|nr:hypothetical protein Pint_06732 [Pistacia integerrima]